MKNKWGKTARRYAQERGHADVVALLEEAEAAEADGGGGGGCYM